MPVRPAAHRAAPRRYRRLGVLCGALLVPVAVLVALYLAGGAGFLQVGRSQADQATDSPARAASPVSPAAPAASTPPASPSASAGRAAKQHAATPPHATVSPTTGSPTTGSPTTGSPTTGPTTPPPSQQAAAAGQVLALINQARAQAGLPSYTLSAGLDSSAAAHNARMAAGCGLSHQCPGEPPLGTRETDAGVTWTAAGENIGEGGPVPDTPAAIAQMAVSLTQDMLNEKPPDDGHRLNILSSTFTHIGIAVTVDSSGTVWMTQDFSN
jgi:uncharacterized protein YkwD